jgi:hypothetical protein
VPEENDMMPLIAYQNIADGVIGVAREFADEAFQNRIWIRNAVPGIHLSYETTMDSLIDDYDLERVVRLASRYGFTEEQAEKLRVFAAEVTAFDELHPRATSIDVVGTRDWQRVKSAAADFVDAVDRMR